MSRVEADANLTNRLEMNPHLLLQILWYRNPPNTESKNNENNKIGHKYTERYACSRLGIAHSGRLRLHRRRHFYSEDSFSEYNVFQNMYERSFPWLTHNRRRYPNWAPRTTLTNNTTMMHTHWHKRMCLRHQNIKTAKIWRDWHCMRDKGIFFP